jgi:hypothetical protein
MIFAVGSAVRKTEGFEVFQQWGNWVVFHEVNGGVSRWRGPVEADRFQANPPRG